MRYCKCCPHQFIYIHDVSVIVQFVLLQWPGVEITTLWITLINAFTHWAMCGSNFPEIFNFSDILFRTINCKTYDNTFPIT